MAVAFAFLMMCLDMADPSGSINEMAQETYVKRVDTSAKQREAIMNLIRE